MADKDITVKLKKSLIGSKDYQKQSVRGLGLSKLVQSEAKKKESGPRMSSTINVNKDMIVKGHLRQKSEDTLGNEKREKE